MPLVGDHVARWGPVVTSRVANAYRHLAEFAVREQGVLSVSARQVSKRISPLGDADPAMS